MSTTLRKQSDYKKKQGLPIGIALHVIPDINRSLEHVTRHFFGDRSEPGHILVKRVFIPALDDPIAAVFIVFESQLVKFFPCEFFLLYLMFSNMRHNLLKTNGFISFVVIVLLVGGVLVSNSKTPLVGIIFLFFAFYGLVTLFKPAIMIPTLLIAFAIYTYFPEYILTFTSIYDLDLADEGGGSTAELREHQMEAAWQLFLRNPLLGNGLGSLAYLRSEDDAVVEGLKGAESSIFQIMPERGIVGILVYFFMFVSLYFKCKSNIPHKELFFYLIAILSMEIVTGQLEMSLWGGMLLAVNRMFALRKMRQYG